jgi:Kef-type K+ transport system membrane component KefB
LRIETPIADPIVQFTVLVTAGLLVRLTIERLHMPGLTGLLLIGMLLGPAGLGVIPREPVVELLGGLGLVYIMFLAGLEVDLDVVRDRRRETAGFGLAAFLLSALPAVAVGLGIGYGWAGAALLGSALASHTLLAYPVVSRLRLQHRRAVVATIGGTLITDTLALVLLALVVQAQGAGEGVGGGLLPLALLAVLVALALLIVPRIARWLLAHELPVAVEKALFVFVVLLVLASAAEFIGTEAILGAFLAGVCLNRPLRKRESLHDHVDFVGRMLFIPFFFVETGMRLELEVFTERLDVWPLAGLLLAAVVFGKLGAVWITGRAFDYGWPERGVMLGLSIPQAAATLAVTLTARRTGLLGEEVVDAVIIVIFATCIAGPLLARAAGRRLAGRQLEGEGA